MTPSLIQTLTSPTYNPLTTTSPLTSSIVTQSTGASISRAMTTGGSSSQLGSTLGSSTPKTTSVHSSAIGMLNSSNCSPLTLLPNYKISSVGAAAATAALAPGGTSLFALTTTSADTSTVSRSFTNALGSPNSLLQTESHANATTPSTFITSFTSLRTHNMSMVPGNSTSFTTISLKPSASNIPTSVIPFPLRTTTFSLTATLPNSTASSATDQSTIAAVTNQTLQPLANSPQAPTMSTLQTVAQTSTNT